MEELERDLPESNTIKFSISFVPNNPNPRVPKPAEKAHLYPCYISSSHLMQADFHKKYFQQSFLLGSCFSSYMCCLLLVFSLSK